jgi:light-harvesting complex I chlorophyll a/b binding protein 5
MPGDFGFDPLYLGADKEQLEWYRNAELIHGRFAMLGTAGILFTDGLNQSGVGNFPSWTDVQAQTFDFADTTTLFLVQMILFSFAEHKRLYDLKNPGSQGAPGSFMGLEASLSGSGVAGYPGKVFDPLNLAKNPAEFEELKVKEIKNGRLAMMAFLGICAQTYSTGAGPHANLVAHVADPWHTTVATNTVAIPHILGF